MAPRAKDGRLDGFCRTPRLTQSRHSTVGNVIRQIADGFDRSGLDRFKSCWNPAIQLAHDPSAARSTGSARWPCFCVAALRRCAVSLCCVGRAGSRFPPALARSLIGLISLLLRPASRPHASIPRAIAHTRNTPATYWLSTPGPTRRCSFTALRAPLSALLSRMKLVSKHINKDGTGYVKLMPQAEEDMWSGDERAHAGTQHARQTRQADLKRE